jgi:NitT/TauT family transport system ATP-binding protein
LRQRGVRRNHGDCIIGTAATGSLAADDLPRNDVVLEFHDATKTFSDGTRAMAPTSFSVREGEIVSLVGPSGCGKSTFLRLASGLERPTSGRVASAAGEDVGYVFQDATLLPWRNVRHNVELLGELRGKPRDERARVAGEMIELVGLQGFERHLPRTLSNGMRMRTSLARALTLRPRLFLFDEPFAAVDEMTRERLNEEVLRLFALQRFAGVFVTHSVAEAVYMGTRVAVMSPRPGRILVEFDVPFGHPREPELRYDARFSELCGKVACAVRESGR